VVEGLAVLTTSYLLVASIVLLILVAGHFLARPATIPQVPFSRRWSTPEIMLLTMSYIVLGSLALALVVQPSVRTTLLPPDIAARLGATQSGSAISAVTGQAVAAEVQADSQRAFPYAGLWAGLLSAMAFAALYYGCYALQAKPRQTNRWSVIRVAFQTWLIITPLILALNVLSMGLAKELGMTPDRHPLVMVGGHPQLTVVFLLCACVATPLAEELLVRGVLLPWACRSTMRSVALFIPAGLLFVFHREGFSLGPIAFFGILALGFWALVSYMPLSRLHHNQYVAIYATSVLFASAHDVWPTPIPLFAFSLVLGWLAVRTGGITASFLVHGLLNTVSAIYVLRGGPV
jgi:membrane protease YdiL (CAAX protease family)